MDLKMRIKKPAKNADFRAMIKDFNLVQFKTQNLYRSTGVTRVYSIYSSFNFIVLVIITDRASCMLSDYFRIIQDDVNVTQTLADPTLTVTETESQGLRPPEQCRGLRSRSRNSTAPSLFGHSQSRSQSRGFDG